jgi:xylan 1,4-beta-xylosidase
MKHKFFVCFVCFVVNVSALSAESLWLDAQTLAALPAGARVHAGVTVTADGLAFSGGGIALPATSGGLSATQGLVSVVCQTPPVWPVAEDRPLFDAQAAAHVHASLLFRNGALLAVYKGGEPFFSSLTFQKAREWEPGSWHTVRFSWRLASDQALYPDEVEFLLHVDGQTVGEAFGRLMPAWPALCHIGERHGTAWQGSMREIRLSSDPLTPPDLMPGERSVTVRTDREVGDCYPFWTVANCNGPHRFLQPGYAAAFKKGSPFISQINAVYLLGGRYCDQNDWFKGVAEDGDIVADFTGLIAQLRAMLDGGFQPWVVLDNTPYAMCREPQENTYGNTAPPDDGGVWERYVEAAVRAMVGAFGRERVGGWWFRVGTEPDLYPGHWTGTKEQYFEHYGRTVAAVGRVLPEARIGPGNVLNPFDGQFGTATRSLWGLDIIDHAGTAGTRMDWFSFSWYGRVGRPLSEFDTAVRLTRERLARYPALAGTPLIVGEFAVLHDESGRRLWSGDTTEWAASFYAGIADCVYRYGIRQVYEWAQTTGGLLHPRTQVIAMLDRMSGGRRVAVEVQAVPEAECGAVACRKGDDLFVLLYNHRGRRRPQIPETVRLVIRDPRMKPGAAWTLKESRIDARSGTWAHAFAADCKAAGVEPLPGAGRHEGGVHLLYGPPGQAVFSKNIEKYRALSRNAETQEEIRCGDGGIERDIVMEGHSVRLLQGSPNH